MSESYTIYYWNACEKFYGRAIGMILTLEAAGAKYTVEAPDKCPPGKGVAYPQLVLKDGLQIAQQACILEVLAERHGLNGKTAEHKILFKQYIADLTDVFGEYQAKKFEGPDGQPRRDKWFALLESRLNDGWMLGDAPTTVDYYGVFTFEWLVKGGVDFSAFPKLTNWWTDVKALPACQKLYNSGVAMIP